MTSILGAVAQKLRKPTKGAIYRLDSSGHGMTIQWRSDNEAEVAAAREMFDDYKERGWGLFEMAAGGGQGRRLDEFDPAVRGIIAVPRLQGG